MTAAGEVDQDAEDEYDALRAEVIGDLRDAVTDVLTELAQEVLAKHLAQAPDDLGHPQYMTREQLGHQVVHGRKTTFFPPDGDDPIRGYLGGWDRHNERDAEKNYLVLIPSEDGQTFEQQMISQQSRMILHMESTYDDEPCMRDMEKIVVGFRYYVSKRVLRAKGKSPENHSARSRQNDTRRGRRHERHS